MWYISSGLQSLKIHNPCSTFFRLPALKNLERPVAFLRFFALSNEKIHYNYCELLGFADHWGALLRLFLPKRATSPLQGFMAQ